MPARYAPARYVRRHARALRAPAGMPARYARTDFNQLMLIPQKRQLFQSGDLGQAPKLFQAQLLPHWEC